MEITQNWRIKKFGENREDMFFIEADLPPAYSENNYPRVEVMQEDFGDHNGYTHELRMNDALLCVDANLIYQSTNKLPSELAETNKELLEALKIIIDFPKEDLEHYKIYGVTMSLNELQFNKILNAIKKHSNA